LKKEGGRVYTSLSKKTESRVGRENSIKRGVTVKRKRKEKKGRVGGVDHHFRESNLPFFIEGKKSVGGAGGEGILPSHTFT